MIHEEICTYEVCKLAKEKGSQLDCIGYYDFAGEFYLNYESAISNKERTFCHNKYNNIWHRDLTDAPTQSLLQRWLREEKNIHIEIIATASGYYWCVNKTNGTSITDSDVLNRGTNDGGCFDTFEECLEDALKYALENLGRMTDQELKDLMTKGVDDDYNIYDQFNYDCDVLWRLITSVCLNANPPIRVREHTLKSLKEAGVHCTLKVEGNTSKLELWRGDELVGVVIKTKPKRVGIGID